jgi:type II secretory pathway pseudopilin PulG
VVSLTLLAIVTLLAIAGMNAATLELQMAGNAQAARRALQAADYAIEDALAKANYDLTVAVATPVTPIDPSNPNDPDSFSSITTADASPGGITNAPTDSSLGEGIGALRAYHFNIAATGVSSRNAVATTTQGFYIIGPGT